MNKIERGFMKELNAANKEWIVLGSLQIFPTDRLIKAISDLANYYHHAVLNERLKAVREAKQAEKRKSMGMV